MAHEAVIKVKEAEDAGNELIRNANEEARDILKNYIKNAGEQKDSILLRAAHTRENLIQQAVEKADADCEILRKNGEDERDAILNPGGDKLEKAVRFVTERIVGV